MFHDEEAVWRESVDFLAAAAAQGWTGLLFLRGPALHAYLKDRWMASPSVAYQEAVARFDSPPPDELLKELRAQGRLRVYACSAWIRRWGLGEWSDRLDAVVGLTAFLTQSAGGPILHL